MKKITLFLFMMGLVFMANAQYSFDPIPGPTNVAQGSPVTINLNDAANTAGVPASSTGSYDSFLVTADWVAGGGGPWSSEADLTFVTTSSGSVNIDPPSDGGLNSNANTTLTFEGDLAAVYDPAVDGYMDIVLNQSWGGSDADWSNITVTLFESPTCVEPTGISASALTSSSANLDWVAGDSETIWNIEYNSAVDFTPGNGEEENSFTVNNTPTLSLTGLAPITEYYVYYQSNCSTNGLSEWSGPLVFETLCDVFVPDYLENFSSVTFSNPPDCWDEANNGNITTGPTDLGGSSWTADEFLNIGTGDGAYKINMFGGANLNDWILSPQFDLTGGPFQVEFDFAITEWNSSDSTEPLDADDTVQLLMSTDNGSTWIELLLYDSTSVVPIPGIHPVVDLTAYSGQTVQFAIYASEGTEGAPTGVDVDVFVDNFRVRNIPSCPEPNELTATNLTLTSTEVGWTEVGTSTAWNIQYGETGFALGSGTIETNITTNPLVLTGLDPDTSYEFYVQAICGPGDESSYAGPFSFFTGYCESIPSSNDGDGVLNTTIGITDFPSLGDVTYENQTSPVVNVFQGIETNVEITFGHSFTYDTNIWVDFNDDLVFDTSELVYQGESPGGNNPQTLSDSFVIPITAPIGEHRLRIGTADFGQGTPNPCYNGSWGVTLDFTVNIQELTCTLPEALFTTVPDCDTDSFFIDVDITSLGDASSLEISNDFDANTIQALNVDTYQAGPFPFGTSVKIFVMNEQDNNCTISSDTFEVLACPPDNDNPCDATIAFVNDDILCATSTPGTILAATPSGVADPSCGGTADDDIWFQFEAQTESHLIALANITGGNTTDIDHTVYEGSCDGLTEIGCTSGFAELSSVVSGLTVGDTYFIRIYSGGSNNENTTFDLCITPYIAPSNISCDVADNYCSGSEASDILYTYNTINIEPGEGTIDCLFTTPNPTYSTLEIGTSGDILIEMVQNSAFDANDNPIGDELDVDFLLWGPYASSDDLCVLPPVVDCSYSAAPIENVTLLGAQQGEIYLLLITNFEAEAGIIQVRQTNIGDPDAGSTIADINAEIVSEEVFIDPDNDPTEIDEVSVCGFDSVTIQTNSPFADSYIWYKDGFVIPNETSSTLTVTESDNYQVQAFDSQCGSDAFSQIVIVNLYNDTGTIPDQNLIVCDGPEADGDVEFDLEAFTSSLGLDPGFTVSYYTSNADANQAINAVSSPYISSGETLVMRIEDIEASNDNFLGCRQLAEVSLVVNPVPSVNQPMPFEVCDDSDGNVDGETQFDLESINPEVSTNPIVTITYHETQVDADNGTADIASPYTSGNATIYIRVEDNTTGCYNTTSFDLIVNSVPLAQFDPQFDYEVCPNSAVSIIIGLVPENFNPSDVSITWSYNGAVIPGETDLVLDSGVIEQGDYTAEIVFNSSGCTNIVTTFIEELPFCEFPQGISPNNDMSNDTFDLRVFDVTKLEIFNRNGTLVYSKTNYTNEWQGQTNDGEELPVGTYFYTVEYEGGTKRRSAWVYINR